MAITDDSFSLEELTQVLEKKPELGQYIAGAITKVQPDYLSAYHKSIADAEVGKYTSNIATQLESTVKNLTGIDKASPEEKWFDYNQRVLKTFKEKSDQLSSELAELKKGHSPSEAEKQRMAQLEQLVNDSKTEKETLTQKYEKEISSLKTQSYLLSEVAPVSAKRNALIPERAFNLAHNDAISQMTAMAVKEGDKTVFKGADGKFILTNGVFATPAEVYKTIMKDFLEEKKVVNGAGGNEYIEDPNSDSLPAEVNTQMKLSNYLTSKGMIAHGADYKKAWGKYKGSSLPLR